MTEKTDPIQALVESNSAQELKAMASARGIDAKGTKVEIATRLVDQPGVTTADTAPADSAAAEKPKAAAKPAETSTPEGLKPPKVKDEGDGSRTATVKREMTYIDLAAEVGYVGSPRELAAFNGVRNGRLELHPGDKVTIPAPYDPRG